MASTQLRIAKPLPPEDIRPRDYVVVLNTMIQFPSFFWGSDALALAADEPVRIEWLPSAGGVPLRIKAACLPYVLVKAPWGDSATLDVRTHRLARVDATYAKRAWKSLKKSRCKEALEF